MLTLFRDKTKRLKIVSFGLLFSVLVSACTNDNDLVGSGDSPPWPPMVKVEKGDGEATLFLTDPRPFSNYVPPGPSNPDYFSILISEDLENFSLHRKANSSSNKVEIKNLVNGKSYYFLVTSHKGEHDPVKSATVMTIPSKAPKFEAYSTNINVSMEELLTSFDLNYLSFVNNQMLYVKTRTAGTYNAIEKSAYAASWSKTTNRFVYMTSIQEGFTVVPYELKLFEPETQQATKLLEVPYTNYYVTRPTFTPNGEGIAFLSSENSPEKYMYNLWIINPVTKEKSKVTSFEDAGFYTDSKYDWSESGEELYIDGRYDLSNYRNDIYKLTIATKELTPIIESPWNERSPSLSPDNTKIAFVSDRTGKDELWVYDLESLQYSQVTGESSLYFDSRYTNLQWFDNNRMIITVFEKEKSIPIKIQVN